MLKHKRISLTVVITGVFVLSLVVVPLSIGFYFPITYPIVLQFGNDQTLDSTARTLSSNIEHSKIVHVSMAGELDNIERKACQAIFYVGHGTEEGLKLGNELISWSKFSELIASTSSKEHYFAACYSSGVQVESKTGLGFNGLVDADLAALAILTYYHWPRNQTKGTAFLKELWLTGISRLTQPSTQSRYLGVVNYRGIPFDQVMGSVHYEHPNRAQNGIWSIYSEKVILATDGSDFGARHIGRGTILSMLWGGFIINAVSVMIELTSVFAFAPEGFATKIAAALTTLLTIIGLAYALFVTTIIVDETGQAGWYFAKDYETDGMGRVINFKYKWGQWWWVNNWAPLWIPWPIWGYGGLHIDATPL
jgi:hypothetical protein